MKNFDVTSVHPVLQATLCVALPYSQMTRGLAQV